MFNPHSNFVGIAKCAHAAGVMYVKLTAESVIPTMGTRAKAASIVAAGQVLVGQAEIEQKIRDLLGDLAHWSGEQSKAISNGSSTSELNVIQIRLDAITDLIAGEKQRIVDLRDSVAAEKQAKAAFKAKLAALDRKIRMEEAVQAEAQAIIDRLEKGLDRFIKSPAGGTDADLNLYTDNIKAFLTAKAKAEEEKALVDQRVAALKGQREELVNPKSAEPAPAPAPAPTPAPAPAPTPAPAPAKPAPVDDGFGEVVPADLMELVDENADPAPTPSPFEAGTAVLPADLNEIIPDSEAAAASSEKPFASLVPADAQDLLDSAEGAAAGGSIFDTLKAEAGLGDVGRRLSATYDNDASSSIAATAALMFGNNHLAL